MRRKQTHNQPGPPTTEEETLESRDLHAMAHLQPSQSAIFSPTAARQAASAAKDWNYVDSWLRTRCFHGRPTPPFERNPDTLRALLALAALNEQADEERDLLARAEAAALKELRDSSTSGNDDKNAAAPTPAPRDEDGAGGNDDGLPLPLTMPRLRDAVLSSLEASLSREGQAALDALSATAVDLGLAQPTPESLARRLVDLQSQVFALEKGGRRVVALRGHVDEQAAMARALLAEVRGSSSSGSGIGDADGKDAVRGDSSGSAYAPAPDLARQNLEMQRKVKAAAARLPEARDKEPTAGSSSSNTPDLTIERVQREENEFLDLAARKKELQARVAEFAGLPPDMQEARQELEGLRAELCSVTQRRDAVFEGLVEGKTPRTRR